MTHHEHLANKSKASITVKKAQGTTTKILEMIDENQYCPKIIQQIDAAIGLLKSSKKALLIGHLDHCLHDKLEENKEEAISELVRIFDLK